MSAFPDHPIHFVDWLRTRTQYSETPDKELRESFAPRQVYGDNSPRLGGDLFHPVDSRSTVDLRVIENDQVLLATGNQPPAAFPSSAPLSRDPRYCADPWEDWESRIPPTDHRAGDRSDDGRRTAFEHQHSQGH